MKIKDPSVRSCYSHPLLSKIEDDIDDYRDMKGSNINEDEFQCIVSRYQAQVPDEADLLYDLAYENFLEEDQTVSVSGGRAEEFEGCDTRDFPSYRVVLESVGKHCDEMWEAYDKEVHNYCMQLCNNIINKERVIEIGTNLALYQMSFDEESNVLLRTIFFVLKTLVPYRTNSKYQNSVKRAELWLQEASLM